MCEFLVPQGYAQFCAVLPLKFVLLLYRLYMSSCLYIFITMWACVEAFSMCRDMNDVCERLHTSCMCLCTCVCVCVCVCMCVCVCVCVCVHVCVCVCVCTWLTKRLSCCPSGHWWRRDPQCRRGQVCCKLWPGGGEAEEQHCGVDDPWWDEDEARESREGEGAGAGRSTGST